MGLGVKIGNGEMKTLQISEIYRRKLLNYADSFYELAKSYAGEYCPGENEDRRDLIAEKRLFENRQVLQCHLREVGRIMTDVAGEVFCSRPVEPRLERLVRNAMKEEGILVENPCYLCDDDGGEVLALALRTQRGANISAQEVADMLSVLLDRRLKPAVSSPLFVDREEHIFLFEKEPAYVALTGFARAAREGENTSGDNFAVTETDRGKLVVMLSDGTGSGEQAGKDSDRVLDLMERFLEAGYGTDSAIETVNHAFYLLGEDDNHPTLDVCELDLYRGVCEIRKVGAAVSFLKSGDGVECLSEGNLPLGVFQEPVFHPIRKLLQEGDYIIMVSDGVVDAFGEQNYEEALGALLEQMQEQNPNELAERILRTAVIVGGGHVRDDMTVGVVGIWRTD